MKIKSGVVFLTAESVNVIIIDYIIAIMCDYF